MDPVVKVCAEHMDAQIGKVARGKHVVMSARGRGETARAIALCSRIAKRDGEPPDLVTIYDGTMGKLDMAHAAKQKGSVGNALCVHEFPRTSMLPILRDHYEMVYDAMPVAVGVHTRKGGLDVARLGCYADLYAGYPHNNWQMARHGKSWWEIMSDTTGLTIEPKHLKFAVPHECAPIPAESELPPPFAGRDARMKGESDDPKQAMLPPGGTYVTFNTSAGPRCRVKLAPPDVWIAIFDHLANLGIQVVQVGSASDWPQNNEAYKGVAEKIINRTGLRLPLTVRLMEQSIAYIGNEGFLHYLAAGMGLPAVALFGPTPQGVYAFPGNLNLQRRLDNKMLPCPAQSCLWDGALPHGKDWAAICKMHKAVLLDGETETPVNPYGPYFCGNMEDAQKAAGHVGEFIMALRGTFKGAQVVGAA